MINIIKNFLHDHNILHAEIIIQLPLVVQLILTLALANALLVLTTPLLDAINNHIVLLLNHAMTATAVALALIQNHTQITKTNPLLVLFNNPLQKLTIPHPRNLSLKLTCIILTPRLLHNLPLLQITKPML